MNILILSQFFTPEPDLKGLPLAKELTKMGHSVKVLTGFPNYPGGKIYSGYKLKLYSKENIEGIKVYRSWLYPSHDHSKFGRIFNYLSFAVTASFAGIFGVKKIDAMYVYHPPATIILPAILLKITKRAKIVYDIQDLWPDTLSATGMVTNRSLLRGIDILLSAAYKFLDDLVVLSPGFKNRLISKGVPSNKVHTIPNWSLEAVTSTSAADDVFSGIRGTGRIIVFAGTMGKAQALGSILQAAKIMFECGINYNFAFIGGGIEVENLKDMVISMNIPNVMFIPKVTPDKIGDYLRAADLLLVHLKKDPLFEITIPSKLQAYMRIGKPILCGLSGDGAEIVQKAKCGFVFKSENPDAFVSLLEQIKDYSDNDLARLGLNGKEYYDKNFDISIGASEIEKLLVSGN